MDSSHVSLCALLLKAEGFSHYRCDRNMSLGLNLVNVGKILKCANNSDMITLKADDEGDVVSFIFESESGNSMADFEMKLMVSCQSCSALLGLAEIGLLDAVAVCLRRTLTQTTWAFQRPSTNALLRCPPTNSSALCAIFPCLATHVRKF